jgi:hypothetical protein
MGQSRMDNQEWTVKSGQARGTERRQIKQKTQQRKLKI